MLAGSDRQLRQIRDLGKAMVQISEELLEERKENENI